MNHVGYLQTAPLSISPSSPSPLRIALADEPKVERNDWSRVGPHRASTSPPSGAKSDWHTQRHDRRDRYDSSGMQGLHDEQRPGRPRTVDRSEILAATLTPPPAKLGITHWSSRLLADYLKVDAS